MMRLKKGTKVEVFSRKDASIGSWRCGEIISGNGHTYNVKFDWFPLTNEILFGAVERVPRKAIRPCPPPVCRTNNWVRGDFVEVFHNLSWKNATIVKNIGANNFVVGLVGSSQDFIVHQTHLRVRQSWDDGKWFIVGKGSANGNISAKRISTDARRKLNTRVDCSAEKNIEIKKHNTVFLQKRKMGSPLFGLSSVAVAKKRMIENGCGQKFFLTHLSVVPDETSSVYPQELLGKKCFMSHISDVDSVL